MTDLYELAKKYFVDTQNKQIQKGLSTYGKALDPAEWTTQQLYQHAMDEIVDNVHYLTALLVRSEAAVKRAAEMEIALLQIKELNVLVASEIAEKALDKSLFPIGFKKQNTITKEEAMKMMENTVMEFVPDEPECKHKPSKPDSTGKTRLCYKCGQPI